MGILITVKDILHRNNKENFYASKENKIARRQNTGTE